MSITYRLAAVIFSACVLNSQAQSSTTAPAAYIMKYKFNLYTNPPLETANAQQIQNAADIAIYSLKLDGKIQTVANPTKTTQKINGVDQPVWDVLLNIQFPSTIQVNVATSALSSIPFSNDLQDQMRKKGITSAQISKAQLQAPGQGYVPLSTPTTATPLESTTTTTTKPECGKSSLVGGLLTLFLGGLGAGRFYYGYIGLGVGWLFWTLFAHIGTAVGQGLTKAGGGAMIAGIVISILAALSQIGTFVWWIHDLVVMFNRDLKPFDMSDCEFSD